MKKKIPDPTISRLSVYARCLDELIKSGVTTISSEELANLAGANAAQVRKDLSYLGSFGRRGVGYHARHLRNRISRSLGLTRERAVVIVGVGKLGAALLSYKGFRERGFSPVAAFDNNKAKIGQKIAGVKVYDISSLRRIVKEKKVDIGIITVPSTSAQKVADRLVEAGVRSILNFAPVVLKVPSHIILRQVDLSLELEAISYYLNTRSAS